ncbi:MAG: serine O-acetyltransferase [Acidimicrobiales bacterium]
MLATLRSDLQAARDRDPAARSSAEIILCYPGLHAVWSYRISHWLWLHKAKLAARVLSTVTRSLTGVDIHPGAVLGGGLLIDHATGVVIGETAEVGAQVTLYQGVTLGGTSLSRGKRHPTVGDRVTIGAGAKILGPIAIGHDSQIGANAVVVRPVPAHSVVVGVPGQVIARSRPRPLAAPPEPDETLMPDLVGTSLQSLLRRVDHLETAVNGHANGTDARPSPAGVWSGEDFSI